ncbi:hypothetical protein JTB14_007498 [Gonioctena quinquepunctata]|nr:hypothetical protein JTB14_007498 [Gonioctena quinquepunctata]
MRNSNFFCEKEVNIDAIKSDSRKLLNEKSSEVSPKEVQSDYSHRRGKNTPKVVIHNENITLDDSEVEIFNSPSISSKSRKAAIKTKLVSPTKTSNPQNNLVQLILENSQNLGSSSRYQESILLNDTKTNDDSSPKTNESSFEIIHSCNKDENIDEEVERILNKQKNGSSGIQMKNRKKTNSIENKERGLLVGANHLRPYLKSLQYIFLP